MMLYCKACRQVVAEGDNQCRNCGNGFVSPLVCGACGGEVARGGTSCARCVGLRSVPVVPIIPDELTAITSGGLRPPAARGQLSVIPGLPLGLPVPVRESYNHGRFGVTAVVTMEGRDAEILTKMQQVGALLNVLAAEMNNLQGHMQSTREVIKGCRRLALEIQEEVEVRLGPQG